MAFDLEKTEQLINSISLELMMLSTENLVDVSALWGRMESLEPSFAAFDSELPAKVIQSLQDLLAAIIRGQVSDIDTALSCVSAGLSHLQELSRSLPIGAPFNADLNSWAESLAALNNNQCFWQEESDTQEASEELPQENNLLVEAQKEPVDSSSTEQIQQSPFSCELFKKEIIADVENIQVLLVATEQKSDPLAALGELGCYFHSLLAGATLLQLEDMAKLAYNSTRLLEYVTAEQVQYSTKITDMLLQTCDYFITGLQNLEMSPDNQAWHINPEAYSNAEFIEFNDKLWMASQGLMPAVVPSTEVNSGAASRPIRPKKIGEILVERGLISEGDLGGLIQAQQDARKATLGEILINEKIITDKELAEALKEQAKNPERRLGEILVSLGILDSDQIDLAIASQVEKRETKLGEFLVKSKIGAPEKVALALREQKISEGKGRAEGEQLNAQMVKVETQKLDGLIDLVGELVIAQSLVTSNNVVTSLKEQKLTKDLTHVSRITSELQSNAMSLRMVQVSQTFQKMQRMVRDLSHRFDKDVRFETQGGDTEVDRNVVESIYDPLVHLMRNALDHGLETPSERRAAGKPSQGLVKLKAYHQGGNVVIEIIDDGRGLDQALVLEKAVTYGLISPNEVLSESAVHSLVFHPGFSTAATVSDISGRGIGLDVVRTSIEKIRGKVDFSSVAGRGSTMTIRLPLTLAIIDGMIIRVGEHRYILPTISIFESFRPTPEDYFTVRHQGEMIRVREHFLPLIRLGDIVGAIGALTDPGEALVVVVENEGEKRCLLVDEVLGKQEVVIKSLGDRLKQVRSLAGGTILGDGRVGLILDVAGLFEISENASGGGMRQHFGTGENITDDWQMDEDWE